MWGLEQWWHQCSAVVGFSLLYFLSKTIDEVVVFILYISEAVDEILPCDKVGCGVFQSGENFLSLVSLSAMFELKVMSMMVFRTRLKKCSSCAMRKIL